MTPASSIIISYYILTDIQEPTMFAFEFCTRADAWLINVSTYKLVRPTVAVLNLKHSIPLLTYLEDFLSHCHGLIPARNLWLFAGILAMDAIRVFNIQYLTPISMRYFIPTPTQATTMCV